MNQIKTIIFSILLPISTMFLIPVKGFTQNGHQMDKALLKKMADSILAKSTFDFYIPGQDIKFKKIDQNNYTDKIIIKSPYNEWKYWNGVLNMAMIQLSEETQDNKYKEFAVKNYEFAFDNVQLFKGKLNAKTPWSSPFKQLIQTEELDDCGAIGAGLVEVSKLKPRKDFNEYLQHAGKYILEKQIRLPDATFVRIDPSRYTLWADDLYMGTIFLSKMGRQTGENKYFDDAILQVKNFTKYLYNNNNGLYYHCWYSDNRTNGVAHWSRCNGWVMMAQAELLESLPKNHPMRIKLIKILEQHIIGVSKYQDISGLWHQLIDKNDSYLETSGTAMFVYSIAKAVNNGWIDKRYTSIALEGWKGIKRNIQEDGQVKGICIGTGIENHISYYYNRPTPLNDIHGLGPVLMAGIEVLKLPSLVYE